MLSRRAPDSSAGAPTGLSSRMGFYPGTQNSRCHLSPCLSDMWKHFKRSIAHFRLGRLRKVTHKWAKHRCLWSVDTISLQPVKENVSFIWRSDAAANVRRQGCKSLTHSNCLVSHQLRACTAPCWICVSITFSQGIICDVLISRSEPKITAFSPSSASMTVCTTSKYHLRMTQKQWEK